MSLRQFNLRNETTVKASLGPAASDLNFEAHRQSHVFLPEQHHSFPSALSQRGGDLEYSEGSQNRMAEGRETYSFCLGGH